MGSIIGSRLKILEWTADYFFISSKVQSFPKEKDLHPLQTAHILISLKSEEINDVSTNELYGQY